MFGPTLIVKALLGLSQLGYDQVARSQTSVTAALKKSLTMKKTIYYHAICKFSPKWLICQMAFENNDWTRNRPGKQPGGYMESVPDLHESRIFLTYTGSVNDAATIAHELGHAFILLT